jgi:hypothetical protein
MLAPLSIGLGSQRRWPRLDEGPCSWVPPAGVLYERDGHRVLDVICSFAEGTVENPQEPAQDVALPCVEGLDRVTPHIGDEKVREEGVVVRQVLVHDGHGLRHVDLQCVEEVRLRHAHTADGAPSDVSSCRVPLGRSADRCVAIAGQAPRMRFRPLGWDLPSSSAIGVLLVGIVADSTLIVGIAMITAVVATPVSMVGPVMRLIAGILDDQRRRRLLRALR